MNIKIQTQSLPFLRCIPIKGPLGSIVLIKSFARLRMASLHIKYSWRARFSSCTGKGAGAPVKAKTGYWSGGNLKEVYSSCKLDIKLADHQYYTVHIHISVDPSIYKSKVLKPIKIFPNGLTQNKIFYYCFTNEITVQFL